MIFPEIRSAIKDFAAGFGSDHIALDLKGLSGFEGQQAEWYARNGFNGLAGAWGYGSQSWSGERVSLHSALNHSVVWACNRAISEPLGFLPLSLMQETSKGKQVAYKHPMYSALHDAPNDDMSAMSFRESRTSHVLLQGNGYAQIIRRSGDGTAIELQPIDPNQVKVDREAGDQKRLVYVVSQKNGPNKTYTVERGKPHDILHVKGLGGDGVTGYSVLTAARQSIGTGLSTERHVGRFYAQGGRLPYNLKLTQPFKNSTDADRFRNDWEKVYSEPNRAPILEPWLEYQSTGLNLKDSQMLETREFTVAEICRWFNVSPHLAGDLSHATFSNVEQLALDHIKFCLSAWFSRWESDLWRCILTPAEKKQGYYFHFNANALLRGDFVSRMAGYASGLQNGHLNQDEVRDFEDLNPLPNGEGSHYRVQLNMQTLTPDGVPPVDPAAAQIAATKPKK